MGFRNIWPLKSYVRQALPSPPVFIPTEEELSSPVEWIRKVVVPAAAPFGLAIIRPPMNATLGAEIKVCPHTVPSIHKA